MVSLLRFLLHRWHGGWKLRARRYGELFCVVGLILVCLPAHTIAQERWNVRFGGTDELPPGAIGRRQLLRGGPLRGYIQPVQITAPDGAVIAPAVGGAFEKGSVDKLTVGLYVGNIHRFIVSNIDRLDGVTLYPSVELIDRLHPPGGMELKYPVPIELTAEELRWAAAGKYITRVIYVEDPLTALATAENSKSKQRYFEVHPSDDAIAAAAELGRPIAILRMGAKIPDPGHLSPSFLYGSPPFVQYDGPPLITAGPIQPSTVPHRAVRQASADIEKVPSNSPQEPAPIIQGDECTIRPALPRRVGRAESLARPCKCPRGHPRDEYLCDGGDSGSGIHVTRDWEVKGLDLEDTIAHYDTLDARVKVVPSNRVCVYAPRFAAVRKVTGLQQEVVSSPIGNINENTWVDQYQEHTPALAIKRDQQSIRAVGRFTPQSLEEKQRGVTADATLDPNEIARDIRAYESITNVSSAEFDVLQMPYVAELTDAAATWSVIAAPQVIIDNVIAVQDKTLQSPGEVYDYEVNSHSQLRIVKVASCGAAKPGDSVDFTIRFQNTGTEVIGNVTIIDNLTTRLEYVDKSQECTAKAEFFTKPNDGKSLELRWEVAEPLEPGEGGVIRFRCKVR